jgi:TonB family protein
MSARLLAACAALVAFAAVAADPAPTATPAPAPAPASDGAANALERVPPEYPPALQKKGTDGCVVVAFMLDAEGHADQFEVLESQPQGKFDATTMAVLPKWRFAPPPRPGKYAQVVHFRLKGREPKHACKPLPSFAQLNPGAGPLTREVRVLERVYPRYARSGESADGGCVTVRFQIRHDGFVGDVKVLEARPESLAGPTVDALKQWHFQSFPPPDLWATQTFNFAPDLMRMPDTMVRGSLADLSGGEVRNTGCSAQPGAKP